MQEIDYENYYETWGWFTAVVEEIPNLQPQTLYLEASGDETQILGPQAKLNNTERGGGSLLGLCKRYPIEARIDRIVKEKLSREERLVMLARYSLKSTSGKPLSIARVSKTLGTLTCKQVENRLKKGKKKVREHMS